jgi:hypothetical protein
VAAAGAKKAAKATSRKKPAARKAGSPKRASRARRPAPKRTPSRKTATARSPRATAGGTAGTKRPARTRAARPASTPVRKVPPTASPAPQPRSPRTAAPAGRAKVAIGLLRERRALREEPPRDDRSEDENRYSGAARTGQDELLEKLLEHTETGPVMTGGDLDANWEHAYSSGDEAPGGDNPTPDQGLVDDNGKALGIHYDDNEELRLGDKEAERDRHRWELDPASAEDYPTRDSEE